jgi:hypothetical protein
VTSAAASVIAETVDANEKPVDALQVQIFPVTIPTLIFQVVMILTAFYFGMLFLNWGDINSNDELENRWMSAKFSGGVKLVTLQFSFAIFSVSILLNLCCKDRIL